MSHGHSGYTSFSTVSQFPHLWNGVLITSLATWLNKVPGTQHTLHGTCVLCQPVLGKVRQSLVTITEGPRSVLSNTQAFCPHCLFSEFVPMPAFVGLRNHHFPALGPFLTLGSPLSCSL